MEFLARVNPKYFAAIHLCSANQDVRYYLNAVQIERHPEKGVIIVATNGHMLGAVHDPDGWLRDGVDSVLVGKATKRLLAACQAKRGSDGEEPKSLWIASKFSVVSSSGDPSEGPEPFGPLAHLTEKSELVDGRFPDWRKAIPASRSPMDTSFPWINGEYLETFHKVAIALSGQKRFAGGGLHLEPNGERNAVVVRLQSVDLEERFFGVIMTMRGNQLDSMMPAWLSSEPSQAVA